ncbi:MAG: hypothetical protein JWN70_4263 [Planctomycetaceae bacterium]|nr:hypothetical protein [Planctomycetaceae bacterium]
MFSTLHQDLRPYLDGIVLRHPQVQYDFAYPPLFGRINRWYEQRKSIEAGQYIPNDWDRLSPGLHDVDRMTHYLLETFSEQMTLEEWLTPERLRLCGQAWTAPEVILRTSTFWPMVAGPAADISAAMDQAEREHWEHLPEFIPIYRAHRDFLLEGCCWYPDRSTAFEWSVGFPDHLLSRGTIAKQYVRAVFTRQGETEFIVQPQHVYDIVTTSPG